MQGARYGEFTSLTRKGGFFKYATTCELFGKEKRKRLKDIEAKIHALTYPENFKTMTAKGQSTHFVRTAIGIKISILHTVTCYLDTGAGQKLIKPDFRLDPSLSELNGLSTKTLAQHEKIDLKIVIYKRIPPSCWCQYNHAIFTDSQTAC